MPRKKVNPETVDKVEETTVTVANVTKNGRVLRTYTVTDHGADFVTLAESYASKFGGVVETV